MRCIFGSKKGSDSKHKNGVTHGIVFPFVAKGNLLVLSFPSFSDSVRNTLNFVFVLLHTSTAKILTKFLPVVV